MSTEKNKKLTRPETLLDEFAPPSFEAWQIKTTELLTKSPQVGRSFDSDATGLQYAPIFTAEDIADLPHLDSYPGLYPYLRSGQVKRRSGEPWLIMQAIPFASAEQFNQATRLGLNSGLSGVTLTLDRAGRLGVDPDKARVGDVGWEGLSLANVDELAVAFEGIELTKQPLKLDSGCAAMPLLANLSVLMQRQNLAPKDIHGWLTFDPLAELAAHGELPLQLSSAFDEMAELIRWNVRATAMTAVQVSAIPYQEAGLSAAEQLGCLLATVVCYFREMESRGVNPEELIEQLSFGLSVGPKLFVEIAKLRACRLVWAALIRELKLSTKLACPKIHLTTSASNRTIFDRHINLLRGATESFSAIVGGCDSLTITPFDHGLTTPNEFSLRLARNHQLILKHEAHLGAVIDPAGGSYYVEKLTNSLAERAWQKFVEIENAGGMIAMLRSGRMTEWTGARIASVSERVARRQEIVVGINKYVDLSATPVEEQGEDEETRHNARAAHLTKLKNVSGRPVSPEALSTLTGCWKDKPAEAISRLVDLADQGATLGELTGALRASQPDSARFLPLTPFRPAEMFEKLRQSVIARQTSGSVAAKIMIAPVGDLATLQPRLDFVRECFAVASLETECEKAYVTADEALFHIGETKPKVVVICATDHDYPEIVPVMGELIKKDSSDTTICLAGYPADQVDRFEAAGIEIFLYQGCDLYSALVHIGHRLGAIG